MAVVSVIYKTVRVNASLSISTETNVSACCVFQSLFPRSRRIFSVALNTNIKTRREIRTENYFGFTKDRRTIKAILALRLIKEINFIKRKQLICKHWKSI